MTQEPINVPQISFANFGYCKRSVRRKYLRAFLKMHGVPKPARLFPISAARTFKRLNFLTLLESLREELTEELPRMDVLGNPVL